MTENEQQVPERDHKQRSLVVSCPSCGAVVEARLGPGSEPARLPDAVSCASCSTTIDLPHGEQLAEDGTLDGCPSCGYHTLCIQKDVNPRLGVILVAVSFAILLFSGLSIPQMLVGLVVLAVVDLALPGMNGLEVLKANHERHADIEAIMLTGHGTIPISTVFGPGSRST